MRGLARIIGQSEIVSRLGALKDFYTSKGLASEHILLAGQNGCGKRTIAQAYAEELGAPMKSSSGALLERKGDLTAILTSLEPRQIFLLDEIHRLRQPIREVLYPALLDFQIKLVIGQGPGARVHAFKLNRFTCIATVPKESDCPSELREAFPVALSLRKYSDSELARIAHLVAETTGLSIADSVASLVASASGGSPHQAEVLIRRLAAVGKSPITEEDALQVLSLFGLAGRAGASTCTAMNLDLLSGIEFERSVTSLLQRMGFRAEMTKASGDGGIDIIAVLEKPIVGGRYLIQCKRLAADSLVGASVVREFYGAVRADREAVKGILITTSGFTDQAREFAQSVGLELIDMEKLRSLLAEHGMESPGQVL